MKKKTLVILMAVALLSVASAGIGKAYAYFTTNDPASGSQQISLGDQTTITEEYDSTNWIKKVTITNKSDSSQAVYVRAKAFAGSDYTLDVTGWGNPDAEGYYYYLGQDAPVAVEPGKATGTPLSVQISGQEQMDPKSFNVVIVYETTPAVQNGIGEDGSIQYEEPDWDRGLTAEGGENS